MQAKRGKLKRDSSKEQTEPRYLDGFYLQLQMRETLISLADERTGEEGFTRA